MAKKTAHNQKILLMTDSASDISDQDLTEGGIVMLPIPITIDGNKYKVGVVRILRLGIGLLCFGAEIIKSSLILRATSAIRT